MVIAAVDQEDFGIGVPQRVRRRESGKTAADLRPACARATSDTMSSRDFSIPDVAAALRVSVRSLQAGSANGGTRRPTSS